MKKWAAIYLEGGSRKFSRKESGYALENLWEVRATMILENCDLCAVLKFTNGWF